MSGAIVGVKSLSNNVGGVKHDLRTRLHALRKERHFSRRWFALSNLGSLLIVRVKHSVRPNHLFDPNCDHDYFFELPCFGERDTQSLRRWLLRTIAISGHSRVRTELLHLTVVAALTPHPIQMYRQLPRHGYLGDLPSTPHGEVKEPAAPFR